MNKTLFDKIKRVFIEKHIMINCTIVMNLMIETDRSTENDIKHFKIFKERKSFDKQHTFYECEDKGPQIDKFIELSEKIEDKGLEEFIEHLVHVLEPENRYVTEWLQVSKHLFDILDGMLQPVLTYGDTYVWGRKADGDGLEDDDVIEAIMQILKRQIEEQI